VLTSRSFLASDLKAMSCQVHCAMRYRAVEIGALLSGAGEEEVQPVDVLSRPDGPACALAIRAF